ncbi:MAG TPA: RsmD family RNA methyltransferase [Bacteroidia bacterium]|nr:MAG: methyltransferase [Bacteroidetes bacterium OLB10]MBE7511180.1 RsmD family RNA methyltransferase [Bacteroidia bacterium]MBX3107437.1 RsmD family RNA methyltransferase [Bacteroidota bacterium]MCE7955834.1 methyltransferase domain-containing protein [Bacteroidetes bacterium CHB6]MBV6454982.1 Ribosomal RNA small subunit methyltransferase D [Bacteroidia bacterium]
MRIISGKFRGKKIEAPLELPVRPTTDFAKTGLFNILSFQKNLASCTVLDLYSGTGNITYEFISRGVKDITSVDYHKGCTAFIISTLKKLNADNSQVITSDALEWLENCHQQYDIIFADPPYENSPVKELVNIIFSNHLLKTDGLLIIEHSSNMKPVTNPEADETRKYGAVAFSIFASK